MVVRNFGSSDPMELAGSIHGRFQPFHNGHLSYALAALDEVEFMYVGITATKSGFHLGEQSAPHRTKAESNPLSFFDRRRLVIASLIGSGISRDRFDVIPFPIEDVENLHLFNPRNLPCFTTVKDSWNLEKIDLLRSKGFDVRVLENVERHGFQYASGTRIRELYRASNLQWREYMPTGAVALMESADISLNTEPSQK